MTRETVLLEIDGAIATLTLNRPDAANTFSRQLLREAVEAVDEVDDNDDVRVLIVTGAGRFFSAGGDLRDLADGLLGREKFDIPKRHLFDVVEQLSIPVIAAINGAALGGGCELALASDFRIMSTEAKIGLTEILFGQLPRGGGTARLPHIIGLARAKDLIMRGRKIDAETALEYGLVNETAAPDEVVSRARALAEELAGLAPFAVRSAKILLNEGTHLSRDAAVRLESTVAETMASQEEVLAAMKTAMNGSETYRRIFAGLEES